ncbi:zinc finger-containing ubiquitin peptidase 1-like [Clytia hemisphaerica]|uniref:UFSP1/2/DUB catalytic domain-containing protein n=1 Tax=Clytia hemisphaerica TaxID=252671 RepID=A0A7M5V011_9CNID
MSKRRGFSCPVCDSLYEENELEEHVQSHFNDNHRWNEVEYEEVQCQFDGCGLLVDMKCLEDHLLAHEFGEKADSSPINDDSLLAAALQEEETNDLTRKNDRRAENDIQLAKDLQKQAEKELEEKEFKKLQEKYGMTSNGGYTEQFNEKMGKQVGRNVSIGDYFQKKANMMCSMMTGEDTNETRTTGTITVLTNYYQSGNIKGISQVHLSSDTNHYAADVSDNGWGCGYRNTQMLLSSLLLNPLYKDHIEQKLGMLTLPSVPKIQSCIEEAWKEGFDQSGKEQLGGKLSKTKKWIGTTEVAALFRWMNIRARIVDFHKSQNNLHPLMFQWVKDYFTQNSDEQIPPLYIQHQGHSRTIIGLEEYSGSAENQLLIFDPSSHKMQLIKSIKPPYTKIQTKALRKSLHQMKYKQFQLVFIDGVYKSECDRNAGKILSSIRIPPD